MIATGLRHLGVVALGIAATLAASPARAADASAWDGDARSAVRLIAASSPRDGSTSLRAGVEIRLASGWKTYWRYPGDSGVPPRFDFTQSSNIDSITLAWPYPQRFADGSGQSIGYTGNVIFPLRIVAKDPARPVSLKLQIDYAVCEKLCVPAEGSANLVLTNANNGLANDAPLAAAQARVPKPSAIGGGDSAGLAIRSVRQEGGERYPRIVVDVAAPPGERADLFVEGPTAEWALPLPAPVAGGPAGLQRFAFDLDGMPPGASARGALLTLTATAGGSAIEAAARID